MTRSNAEHPRAASEPMLAEVETLRRLAALEIAPPDDRERVLAGVRRELRTEVRPARGISRPWGIALLALGTSTALAATPPGRQLASQVRAALTSSRSEPVPTQKRASVRPAPRRTEAAGEKKAPLTDVPDLPVADATEKPARTTPVARPALEEPAPVKQLEAKQLEAKQLEAKQLEAEERKLVEQARFALGQGRYEDARLLSAEHRQRFPNGKLGPERAAIERQVGERSGGEFP